MTMQDVSHRLDDLFHLDSARTQLRRLHVALTTLWHSRRTRPAADYPRERSYRQQDDFRLELDRRLLGQ